MRYKPWPRVSTYQDTPRKRAALARSQQHQRDKLPLLAALIAEEQPAIDLDRISRPYDPDRYRQPGEPRSSRKCVHGLELLGSQAKLYHVELVAHLIAQLDRAQQSTTRIATTHDTAMGPPPARPESIAPGDRASPGALAPPAT